MNCRTLGRTGLNVSEVGFGAWGIGRSLWVGANDDESIRALHRAIDLGLNFIDTALAYGDGHSEQLVGRVARERKVHVATKVPPKNHEWPARAGVEVGKVFPAEHITACTERSLRNLGRETLDLQQLHVWSDEWVGRGDWLEAIGRLKKEGKVRHFGVSINDHQPENALKLIETGVVDTVQVIYNVFDQSAEDKLFPACERYNIGVIVRVPLDEGGLTGQITPQTSFPQGDFRNDYFQGERKKEVFDWVKRITDDLDLSPDQMAETALRFVLSHPAVSTVIPGMRSVRHAELNCRIGDGKGLPAEQAKKLRAYRWARNFYE